MKVDFQVMIRAYHGVILGLVFALVSQVTYAGSGASRDYSVDQPAACSWGIGRLGQLLILDSVQSGRLVPVFQQHDIRPLASSHHGQRRFKMFSSAQGLLYVAMSPLPDLLRLNRGVELEVKSELSFRRGILVDVSSALLTGGRQVARLRFDRHGKPLLGSSDDRGGRCSDSSILFKTFHPEVVGDLHLAFCPEFASTAVKDRRTAVSMAGVRDQIAARLNQILPSTIIRALHGPVRSLRDEPLTLTVRIHAIYRDQSVLGVTSEVTWEDSSREVHPFLPHERMIPIDDDPENEGGTAFRFPPLIHDLAPPLTFIGPFGHTDENTASISIGNLVEVASPRHDFIDHLLQSGEPHYLDYQLLTQVRSGQESAGKTTPQLSRIWLAVEGSSAYEGRVRIVLRAEKMEMVLMSSSGTRRVWRTEPRVTLAETQFFPLNLNDMKAFWWKELTRSFAERQASGEGHGFTAEDLEAHRGDFEQLFDRIRQ